MAAKWEIEKSGNLNLQKVTSLFYKENYDFVN